MIPLILPLAVLTVIPLFLLFFFKTNAGVVFLAACGGLVLLDTLDPNVVIAAGAIIPSEGEGYVRFFVVLLSMSFAAMMFRHAAKAHHIILHVSISLVLALTLLLILPSSTGLSWLLDASKSEIWQNIDDYRTLVVALGMSLSFLAILFGQRKHEAHSKH
jgi:hypothetical protein